MKEIFVIIMILTGGYFGFLIGVGQVKQPVFNLTKDIQFLDGSCRMTSSGYWLAESNKGIIFLAGSRGSNCDEFYGLFGASAPLGDTTIPHMDND